MGSRNQFDVLPDWAKQIVRAAKNETYEFTSPQGKIKIQKGKITFNGRYVGEYSQFENSDYPRDPDDLNF